MVAFHYPPATDAGASRTQKFSEYLSDYGWDPIVLTATPNAYRKCDPTYQAPEKLAGKIHRAFSLNSARDLSIFGRYPRIFEYPDWYLSWYWHAMRKGKALVRQHQPDVIWSTFPASTAHLIAGRLAKKYNLPWVADFRDPLGSHYDELITGNSFASFIDKKTFETADHLVFVCEQAANLYKKIYFDRPSISVIGNGFDDSIYETAKNYRVKPEKKQFVMSYFGSVYVGASTSARYLPPFLKAIASLKEKGVITAQKFQVMFWGSDGLERYDELIESLGIRDLITGNERISQKEAMQKMIESDSLMLLQGPVFNCQIPLKFYEYVATGNPILALTERDGATGMAAREIGNVIIAPMNDVVKISDAVEEALMAKRREVDESILKYSRRFQTGVLRGVLDEAKNLC